MQRVFFEPYGVNNPYQRLLSAALESAGFEATGSQRYWFIGELIRSRARVVHLHWLTVFFEKTDVVRASIGAALYVLQLLMIRLMRIQVVWTAHNLRAHERKYPRIDSFVTALTVRSADRILVHCEWGNKELLRAFPRLDAARVVVIPHPSYLGCYPNDVDGSEARSRIGIAGGQLVFLFLGAVREYKGIIELMEAYGAAGLDGDALLIIAGKPFSQELRQRIEGIVATLKGVRIDLRFIPDEEVQHYMNAADVVVLPYKHIFTSGAALLAMAFGKAVIAPRIGCMAELLDSAGAFLYDSGDPEGLMHCLQRATRERVRLADMGRHNFAQARALTWEDMAAHTASIYRDCLAGVK